MRVFAVTDRGLVRKENQDYYDTMSRKDGVLGVVCDGMGGAKSGNIASQLASEAFMEEVSRSNWSEPVRTLNDALGIANEAVHHRAHTDPDCSGMGTTLVAAWAQKDGRCVVINIGDSRAYLIQSSGISQITRDHSLVSELVSLGKISPEEARKHPNKNIITRALGTDRSANGDLFEIDVNPGDYLLLCSDGLSNVVTDQELLYEVLYGGNCTTCCDRLLEIALKRGAPDNVTAVLICTGDDDTE